MFFKEKYKNYVMHGGLNKMDKLKKALPFIIPPLAVLLIMGFAFYRHGLYPFGDGTVSWCDMSQQVIPLLTDFKDIFTGKDGMFLNFHNAGGMDLWGVFFFFIASPYTLLVLFVDKDDIIYLVNILTVLKMMTAAVTAQIYFRSCQKKLDPYIGAVLSVIYAFCGYGMLYYQNNIWLDMMYLFPLLMVAFRELFEKKRIIPYTVMLTLMMIVNYYISYMIVVFILLFMALCCWRYRKEEKYKDVPCRFVIGSLLGALLSAVVWIPCFLQFLSSGRSKSVIEQLETSSFITNYYTTFCLLLSTASVIVIVAVFLLDGKKRSKRLNTDLIMLFLMLVPILIEPANLMWHTGSYMSFPCRYAFITIFFALICAGYFLSSENSVAKGKKNCDHFVIFLILAALIYGFYNFSEGFVENNRSGISKYTSSKLFEVNLVGSMGYNSLSHYTSLTSRDYMYMMKQLGYSSYWMEVGSYGGTEFTDALLSVKYLIEKSTGSADAVYSNDTYEIVPTEYYLPLGIVTDADLSGSEELSTGTRSNVQKKLFEQLFGGNGNELITDYEYTTIYGVQDDSNFKPNYTLTTTSDVAYMDYSIDVTDKQTLYFDCFDKLSNSLSEDINGSFMVTVNGQVKQMDYPSQSSNGLLKLGEFENEHVNVRVTLKKDITSCRSYGVFGLHHNVLEKALEQAQTAGLTDSDGKLSGSVNAKAGQKCVLQIPYQEGLKIKVNGKAVSYDKVFGDLVSFDLQEGENTITVTSVPKGFYAGLALTIAGIALTAGYFFIRKKLKFGETMEAAALVAVIGAGAIVIIVVYIAPCILNIYS